MDPHVVADLLNHPAAAERAEGIRQASKAKLGQFLPLILALASDRALEVKYECAQALGIILERSNAAPAELIALADARAPLVRASAAEALMLIGDPRSASVVRRLLTDRSPLVRSYAAPALARLSGKRVLSQLRRRRVKERSSIALVGWAAAMNELKDDAGLVTLTKLLSSRQYRVRCAAANTLTTATMSAEQSSFVRRALQSALDGEETRAAAACMARALRYVAGAG